ncbi:hypothetical protein GCM10009530_65630 [Microbispora corallina]|uniref:DUF7847 domain-containing protein n=1 Tax=Microbispora corallina TaxID=83302 RepID=A0ABQ4G9E6_9ACTN|nr:glycerophosphoryl diester phosphodiesterase membrane domain-containing protein [Microbispora corallina]GIH43593.1 hypothetical protein Mco01_65930 [Microbispora corallina]
MTDGPGSTPDVPPGWAAAQPPPYGAAPGSWASPGDQGRPDDGQAAPPPPPPPPGSWQGHPYSGQQPGAPDGQQGRQGYPGGPGAQPGYQGYQGYGPYGQVPQAPRPGIIPLRPLALGDILDGTIKLIRSNPRATLGLSAIVAAITSVPLAIGQAVRLGSLGEVMNDPAALSSGDATPLDGIGPQLVGTLATLVMTFVATTVLTGILTRVLGRAVFGGRITVGEAWALVRSRVPALLGLVLVQGLLMLAPLIVAVLLFVTLTVAGAFDASGGVGLAVVLALVFLLLYIPYVLFFQSRFALSAPAVVLERRGVTDAMRRSWRLVKGDTWRVLGILLLTQLLAALISGVLSVPFSIGGSLLGLLGHSPAASLLAALALTLGNVVSAMITYPFQAGVNGLLYADRRMRAEAFDLVLQTAAARNATQGWVHASVDDLWHPSYAAGTDPAAPGPYYGPRP